MFMYTTPIFITEVLCLVTTAAFDSYYIELTSYTVLAYSYCISSTMCINDKTTPINNMEYSCHPIAVELV